MRKDVITKRVIQAIAVCFGLHGLSGIYLCVHFVVTDGLGRDFFSILFIMSFISINLLFVVVFVAIAYQNLRHFGPNSIKSMTGLATIILHSILIVQVGPYIGATQEPMRTLLYVAVFSIISLLAYFFYSVVSRKLIQITETKNIQKDAEPDAENGAG